MTKPVLQPERQFLVDQASRTSPLNLHQVALELTRERAALDPENAGAVKNPDRAHGKVVRDLRPKTHGLLLIYPLEQPDKISEVKQGGVVTKPQEDTGLNPNGPPVIGLAFSFPESESAACVEYQVNKRWLNALEESEDHDN
jgi:hypothetical protein